MSKNRKSRRKSRNRKFAASTKPTAELSTTQQNHALTGVSPTVSTTATSEPNSDNDLLVLNSQKSNLCDTDDQIAHNGTSERKRKTVHVVKSTIESSPKRKRSKGKRTTIEELQHHNGCESMDDCTGKIEDDKSLVTAQKPLPEFPFPVDPDDHCESPLEAYKDIVPFLTLIDAQIYSNATNSNMIRIYDPYYCDGAVIRHFSSLGFTNIYNRKEDCYATWEIASAASNDKTSNTIMNLFDVLVTNPPYSEDHIERLIQFVTSDMFIHRQKPWFLLLPQWVHKKDYFINATTKAKLTSSPKNLQPFYLIPKKRYVYTPPPNFRVPTKSDVHKKSSPFISMWYCWGGTTTMNEQLIRHFYDTKVCHIHQTCDLARTKNAIRDLRRNHTSQHSKLI